VCQACEAVRIEQDHIAGDGGAEAMRGRIFYAYRLEGDDA